MGSVAFIEMPEWYWLRSGKRWELDAASGSRSWWFEDVPSVIAPQFRVPLWLPILVLIGGTAFLWYRDRRVSEGGRCTQCGYDLGGMREYACRACGRNDSNGPRVHTSPGNWLRASLLCIAMTPEQQDELYEKFVDPAFEMGDQIDVSLHFLNTASDPLERLSPHGEREFAVSIKSEIDEAWRSNDAMVKDLRSPLWEKLRQRILLHAAKHEWKVPRSAFVAINARIRAEWPVVCKHVVDAEPSSPSALHPLGASQ